MVDKLELYLLKEQAVYGTPEAALIGTDVIELEEVLDSAKDRGSTELNYVGGGFRQTASIPGAHIVTITGKKYLGTDVATAFGQCLTLFEASGLSDSEVSDVHTLTPVDAFVKDHTLWKYSGNKSASGALLDKFGNCVFMPKFTFENGKPVLFEFTGKAQYQGVQTDATQPSITPEDPVIPPFMGATITFNGNAAAFNLLSGEFDAGYESALLKDPRATWGHTTNKQTDSKTKFSFKVYQVTVATDNIEADLEARTGQLFSVAWGVGPYLFTLASGAGKAVVTNIEKDEDDGVSAWTISGVITDNDWSLVVDNA